MNTAEKDAINQDHPVPPVREAQDAEHHEALNDDPSDEDAAADIAVDESFPASDPPAHTVAGGGEPAVSSGYDKQAEEEAAHSRSRKSPLEDPGSPGGTAGTGGSSNEQDR